MISKLDSKKNFLIYLFLTISSIITPLVVSRQFTSIHDLAYFITNSLRIFNGQTIYKDFVEVHSPGSYYITAYLFKLFGVNYLPTYLWMFFVNIISTILIYKIISSFDIGNFLKYLGTIGFGLLGPYSFFSQIWYDSDSLFFLILNVYLLNLCFQKNKTGFLFLVSGFLSFIPFFFKQNIGIVTIFSFNILILFILQTGTRDKLLFIFGQGLGFLSFIISLLQSNSLQNWFFYNFTYATLARFTSPITDIFPIRFINKYNYDLNLEGFYYFFYLLLCSICLKIFLSIFDKKINKYLFLYSLIASFSLIIYFDKLVFAEIRNFLRNYVNLSVDDFTNFSTALIFFTIFSIIGIYFIRLEISIENLLLSYCLIITFFTILFFSSYLYKLSLVQGIEQRSLVSYEYYLKIIFFIFFPTMLAGLFIGFSNKKSYALITIPFLGYLYGTSLSQGVAGSTAASIGIILFLNLAIYDYLKRTYNIEFKIISNLFTILFSTFLFLTAIFGSRYHFIQFENSTTSFKDFEFLTLPSSHFSQQEDASFLLNNYTQEFERIVFVPEATLAYFNTNVEIKVDVHTFDTTTNPYGVIFDTDSIKYFLECNNVEIVLVNTNPHRKYFSEFINNDEKIKNYLGKNYTLIEQYKDFKIYKQNTELTKNDYCNLNNYLSSKS